MDTYYISIKDSYKIFKKWTLKMIHYNIKKVLDQDLGDVDSITYMLWGHGETLNIFLDSTAVK